MIAIVIIALTVILLVLLFVLIFMKMNSENIEFKGGSGMVYVYIDKDTPHTECYGWRGAFLKYGVTTTARLTAEYGSHTSNIRAAFTHLGYLFPDFHYSIQIFIDDDSIDYEDKKIIQDLLTGAHEYYFHLSYYLNKVYGIKLFGGNVRFISDNAIYGKTDDKEDENGKKTSCYRK